MIYDEEDLENRINMARSMGVPEEMIQFRAKIELSGLQERRRLEAEEQRRYELEFEEKRRKAEKQPSELQNQLFELLRQRISQPITKPTLLEEQMKASLLPSIRGQNLQQITGF